ncbi:hypothetical protein WJX72_006882 [[Myrmecia] bisecta]|uniref:Protein kinase domain-containing protein n=1 Tax=[Myrmecia] bisecta TaxID=41462 RepID=A0AAW1QC09_9CHLO
MRSNLALWLVALVTVAAAVSAQPVSIDQQPRLLLEFVSKFKNFQEVYKANNWTGWGLDNNELCPADQHVTTDYLTCSSRNKPYYSAQKFSWTGITCSPNGEVYCIALGNAGLEGPTDSSITALTGLPMLKFLQLQNNSLYGTMAPEWGAFQELEWLELSRNDMTGTLPGAWGNKTAFPLLVQLRFQNNNVVGTLPAEWGEPGAWTNLHAMNMTYNNLTGSIPPSWVPGLSFSSIRNIFALPGNDFCGTVPEGIPVRINTGYDNNSTMVYFEDVTDFNKSCGATVLPIVEAGVKPSPGLAVGAVAGITVAGAVVLAIVAAALGLFVHVRRRRARSQKKPKAYWVKDVDSLNKAMISPPPSSKVSEKSSVNSQAALIAAGKGLTTDDLAERGWLDSNSSSGPANTDSGSLVAPSSTDHAIPEPLWPDSDIMEADIAICHRPDGSEWLLGQGAYGRVCKAVRDDFHEVAVKVFTGIAGQREQDILMKEIAILRSCRNKNVVTFYGVCFRATDVWMVMEYMEGGNLYQALAQKGRECLWYQRGAKIALDIAKGMHFLHSHRVIHLDMKSPNILLARDGTAKIADVGLSRVLNSRSHATEVGAGTFHWMAPEVLMHGRCTEKADVFSFGVILWEIIRGEVPTRGLMTDVRVPEECPADIANLMQACLNPDSTMRPSAKEIIECISRNLPAPIGRSGSRAPSVASTSSPSEESAELPEPKAGEQAKVLALLGSAAERDVTAVIEGSTRHLGAKS